jgi:hypothetical protein
MFLLQKQNENGDWIAATSETYISALAAAGAKGALQARLKTPIRVNEIKKKVIIPTGFLLGAMASNLWLAGVDIYHIDQAITRKSARKFIAKRAA